ncbi:hypothetical protein EJ04DRAFT_582254 [Polyplosphaeria fusca]|uniref:NACHT domain-containing protein n=1 Tax=Polyplosphaeria fusca TaxID=682080 RepID=A0A9P4QIX2_9PLEO|nr:hypothetical protein EJ04DRAFT_582254 [Polyplosphaeria fusca]
MVKALENLALEVGKIVDELTLVLLRSRRQGKSTVFKSIKQAILTTWNKSKIEETVERLQNIRDEVQFHILVSMVEKVDANALMMDAALQSLDKSTQYVVESILQGKSDLAAVVSAQTQESIRREDAREAAAIRRHDDIVSGIGNLQHTLSSVKAAIRPVKKSKILRGIKNLLYFPQIEDRYEIIKPAHQKTFEWAFQAPATTQASWASLQEWLSMGAGVYWVSGKAGSGKSTLMKFLMRDKRLHQELLAWAGKTPLVVASFYFWNPGTTIQKSQEGLFRTIILESLKQMPGLGQVLFPERYVPGASWNEPPTFQQLRRAFITLTTQTHVRLKIALIVDGLDEFEPTDASYTELADIFLEATKSNSVKALLSSRPLSAFEALFEDCPKLRLHELTKRDIQLFVSDRLGRHSRLSELSQNDATSTQDLINEIVTSASGVFLWVKLAVDSLLEGFQNFDTVKDLRKRLRAIPRDLEDLFMRMLKQIPSEYSVQSSRMFQIVRCREFLSKGYSIIRALDAMTLFFADSSLETMLTAPIEPMLRSERKTREKEVAGRLRSRCAGLLELHYSHYSYSDIEASIDGGYYGSVTYLHRSVADWLRKDHIWSQMLEATKNTDFDPTVAVMRSLVMQLKCMSKIDLPAKTWVRENMAFARFAESTTGNSQNAILDEMDRVMAVHYEMDRNGFSSGLSEVASKQSTHWCEVISFKPIESVSKPCHGTFLAFAIYHGLVGYTRAKVEQAGGALPKKSGRPLLDYACHPALELKGHEHVVNPALVEYLLASGADPNEKFDGFSPWQNTGYHIYVEPGVVDPVDENGVSLWNPVLKSLIKHGADPDARVKLGEIGDWCPILDILEIMELHNESPNLKVTEIIKMLKDRGAKYMYPQIEQLGNSRVDNQIDETTSPPEKSKTTTSRARRYLKRFFKTPM